MHSNLPALLLSLSALGLASPTPNPTTSPSQPSVAPSGRENFTVNFSVGSGADREFLTVVLETDGSTTDNDFLLVGRSPATHAGTPAFINGTSTLFFDLSDQYYVPDYVWGAAVVNVGDDYGRESAVYTVLREGDYQWQYDNGTITHYRYSALQDLFACETEINGEEVKILSFGERNNDASAPSGCEDTEVLQYFNVPSSTA